MDLAPLALAGVVGLAVGVVVTLLLQRGRRRRVETELDASRRALLARVAEVARLDAQLQAERAVATSTNEALTQRFEALASRLFDEKSKRFAEENRRVVDPLRTELSEFKRRLDAVHDSETRDRVALHEQVRQLVSMNQRLSEEANRLASALRGSAKTRGGWGELVLERILESAGLTKGREYDVQMNLPRDDGSRAQPDVVLHLPEGRELVVDSKVALVAYEQAMSAPDDETRRVARRAHVEAMRGHVKELSAKSYERLPGLGAVDFVVMFVPIEPALVVALEEDPELWRFAWEKNVLVVGPSSLLFVVRIVAHLLREEQQERHAEEIAQRGAELYDKLAGFVGDLEKVGERIAQAQDAFGAARRKLAEGRGNVIRQAEKLRELGVKPTKSLPESLVEASKEDDSELDVVAR